MNLKRSLSWSVLGEVLVGALQPIGYLILVGASSPAEIGVLNVALLVITASAVIWDLGISKMVVRAHTNPLNWGRHLIVLNSTVAFLISAAVFLSAKGLSEFLGAPFHSFDILVLTALIIPIQAGSSFGLALLQRQGDFKRLSFLRPLTAGAPFVVGAVLIKFGDYGIQSVMWCLLVSQILQALVVAGLLHQMFLTATHRSWVPSSERSFAVWAFLTSATTWAIGWGDSLFVASFLGISDLGIYRSSVMLSGYFFAAITAPLVPVFYAHFSKSLRINARSDFFLSDWLPVFSRSFYLLMTALAAFGFYLEASQLGQWQGAGLVFAHLALVNGVASVTFLNSEALKAYGKQKLEFTVMVGLVTLYGASFYLAASFTLLEFAFMRVCLSIIALVVHSAVIASVERYSKLKAARNLFAPLFEWVVSASLGATLHFVFGVSPVVSSLLAFGLLSLFYFFTHFKRDLRAAKELLRD